MRPSRENRRACIEKLAIRGIRSFSPDREQSIEFFTPLTMIVGANGCGKTTIIECLKYGTTGQAPPGSDKGKAFVHDPKVSGVTEVKAQLKLRFRNKSGDAMVVVRSMNVKQTKATQQYKQMDGVIRTMGADGSKASLTHKCGELDKSVPLFIGVTAAVLNSVIFCHQEESSWPLQEGAVLKKKFDEIFDSARYSKALEVLRKQKLELVARTRELAGDLKGLFADKSAADVLRRKVEASTARAADCDAELADLAEQSADCDAQLKALAEQIDKLDAITKQYNAAKNECIVLSAKLATLQENLGEQGIMEETDEELADFQAKYLTAEAESLEEMRKLAACIDAQESIKAECRKMLSGMDTEKGEISHERKRALEDAAALDLALDEIRGDMRRAASGGGTAFKVGRALRRTHARGIGRRAIPERWRRLHAGARRRDVVGSKPYGEKVAADVAAELEARQAAAALAERAAAKSADDANSATLQAVSDCQARVDDVARSVTALAESRDAAAKKAAASSEELNKLRSVTEERCASATEKHDRAQTDLGDFKRNARAGDDLDAKVREAEADERRFADEISAEEVALKHLESNEAQLDELKVLEHGRKAAAAAFRDAYAAGADAVAAAAADGGAAVEPPAADDDGAAQKFVADSKAALTQRAKRTAADERTATEDDAVSRAEARAALNDAATRARDATDARGAAAAGAHPRLELAAVVSRLDDLAAAFRAAQEEDEDPDARADRPAGLASVADLSAGFSDKELFGKCAESAGLARDWSRALHALLREGASNDLTRGKCGEDFLLRLLKTQRQKCAKCPLCKRDYEEGDEDAIAKLEVKLRGWAKKDPVKTAAVAAAAVAATDAAALEGPWKAWLSRFERRGAAEAAHAAAIEAQATTAAAAADAATALEEAKAAAADARAGSEVCDELAQLCADVRDRAEATEDKRRELERLGDTSGGNVRTTKDVVRKIHELQEAKGKRVGDKAAIERARSTALQEENLLVLRLAELRKMHEDIVLDLDRKKNHEANRTEAQASLRRCDAEARTLKAQDAARRQALTEARADREDQLKTANAKRDAARAAAADARSASDKFKRALARGAEGLARSAATDTRARKLSDRVSGAEEREAAATREADSLSMAQTQAHATTSERDLLKQRVQGNMRLREDRAKMSSRKKARDEIKVELQKPAPMPTAKTPPEAVRRRTFCGFETDPRRTLDGPSDGPERGQGLAKDLSRASEFSQQAVEEKKRGLAERDRALATKRGVLSGRKQENVSLANETKGELKSSRYNDVDEEYRKKLIEQQTTDMAVHDIELYWTSLDKALQNFHSLKITEINRIVRELWSITYMGEDIDQIEIVSGQEAGSTRAARSYNYHVQMRKGDAALDMKGRCSAGQRVLASIVIRLALAETFGLHCGILALDEPTTNLDDANRRSLASGLSRIIADRSKQSNFQLVVITHDEEFISSMRNELASLAGFSMPEHYWRVSRENIQGRHYSRIDKCDMENLQ